MSNLTDPEFIRKLEMLSLLTRKVLAGNIKADRKSRKKGSGIHFADIAEYKPGDDLRSVDWNILARLEQMVIKLYEVEEDTQIYLLLDLSPSMTAKIDYARQVTAALAYIALNNQDKLCLYSLSDTLEVLLPMARGRNRIFPMLEILGTAPVRGKDTCLETCVRTLQARHKRSGLCVIISDFFLRDGYAEAFKFLRWSKNDVYAIQVVDPEELKCNFRGDVRFRCIETGLTRDLTIDQSHLQAYASAMDEWNRNLRRECARNGIGYAMATTDIPFETIILNILRKGGLVA